MKLESQDSNKIQMKKCKTEKERKRDLFYMSRMSQQENPKNGRKNQLV